MQKTGFAPAPATAAAASDAATIAALRARIDALTEAQERVTAALVESNDRLTALRALIEVPVGSLDDGEALRYMLTEGMELTQSDAVVLLHGTTRYLVGDERRAAELIDCLVAATPGSTRTWPLAVPGAAGMGATFGRPESPIRLGMVRAGTPYSTGDVQFIEAVVDACEKLIVWTGMARSAVKQATMKREHQLASTLAQAVMSSTPPRTTGVDVFAITTPASVAGGDFIALEQVDGDLWFAVGDVAGKGLPAAVVMTRAISAVRVAVHSRGVADPADALAAAAEELHEYLTAVGLFVSMVIGTYRPGSGTVVICNAGHSPVLKVRDGEVKLVPPSVPPLGVVPGLRGRAHTLTMSGDDVLLLGSDGLVEQENPAGELLGYTRFEQLVRDLHTLPVAELGAALLAAVDEHADGTPPSDDRTLVLLRPHSAPRPA